MPNPFASFKNTVILTGLLLLILLALVWFVGPHVGLIRSDLRVFICLVLVLLWVIFLLIKKGKSSGSAGGSTQVNVTAPSLQAPTITAPTIQAPTFQAPSVQAPSVYIPTPSMSSANVQISATGSNNMNQPVAASADEAVNFRAQLDRALQWLRRSKTAPSGPGDAAYRLPWYLVLGPPSSGKSVLLSQSGLNFPYTDPDRSMGRRNVEPTRCCDLWMANEAFFIDTAGRFCSSDQDRPLWQGLLEEIKRVRKEKPLDGVVLVVDLPALIQANPDALRELAVRTRARLDEITQQLGMVLPVYLMFNKSDRIEGFVEFFSDLDDSLRSQVWGTTLKREQYQNIQPHQEFEKEFGLLSQVIHIRRLSRLTTKAHEIKEKLYSFPVQYELIRNQLSEFITSLFQPNNFRERPIFRGFYFTSALQDSDTIDIVSNYINRKAGITELRWTTPPAAEAKGFFFYRLLTQVIFPDRMLSGSSVGSKKRGLFLKILLILLFGVILPILMWSVYSSYSKYDRLLTTIQRAAQSPIVGNRSASELRVLRLLREELERYDIHYHPEAISKFDWGMNISRELIEPARRFYLDRLKQDFVNKASHDFQVELTNLPTSFPSVDEMRRSNQRCYLLLKTFLMMSTPKVGDEQYLSKSYSELGKFWELDVASEDLTEAQAEMKFYMHLLAVHQDADLLVPLDDPAHTLVTAKRGILGGIDLLSNYYNRLKAGGAGQVPMSLGRALEGKDTDLMTGLVEIPGIFTRAGWESYSRKTIDDFGIEYDQGYWVLDRTAPNLDPNRPPREAMTVKLSELYFTDYNNHWRNFIANARIAPFSSRREAADKLGRLTRQDSPMLRFFKAVSVNTFEELEGKPSGNGYLDRLASNYHSIHQLVNGANAPISQYLQAVARVHQQLSAFVNAGEMPDQITPVKTAITDSLAQMAGLLQNFDPEMMRLAQPLMEQPIKMALEKTPMTETPTAVPAQILAPLTPPTAQTSGVPGGMVVGGMITDRQKGAPLDKVVVYLLKPGNTEVTLNNYIALGTTDSNGSFKFPKAIAAGRYGLFVKAKGYKIIAQDINLSPGNAQLKIGLEPQ